MGKVSCTFIVYNKIENSSISSFRMRTSIEYEEEEERRQEELDKKVVAYINSLSKEELRQTLYEVLYDGADWVFERFVRDHIEY